MKEPLLLACSAWLVAAVGSPAQSPKPTTLKVRSSAVFERAAVGLEPVQLLRSYSFKVSKVTRNRHEPAVRDSLLIATTAADHLELFKNRYNAFLIKAALTSTKISFGPGLRIGASQAAFCKAYGLRPGYQAYEVTDAPEEAVQLRFDFAGGNLQKVSYRLLRPFGDID